MQQQIEEHDHRMLSLERQRILQRADERGEPQDMLLSIYEWHCVLLLVAIKSHTAQIHAFDWKALSGQPARRAFLTALCISICTRYDGRLYISVQCVAISFHVLAVLRGDRAWGKFPEST